LVHLPFSIIKKKPPLDEGAVVVPRCHPNSLPYIGKALIHDPEYANDVLYGKVPRLELPTCQAHSPATYTPVHSYSGSLSTVHQATIPAQSQWIYLLWIGIIQYSRNYLTRKIWHI